MRPLWSRRWPATADAWVALVAVAVVSWFLLGAASATVLSVLVLAFYYGIAGSSFNFLYGSIGVFSLAQPVFVAVGGYTAVYLYVTYRVSPWYSLVIAMVIAACLALPVGLVALRRRGTIVTALVTLILSEAVTPVLSAIKPLGSSIGLYEPLKNGSGLGAMQFGSALPFARLLLLVNLAIIGGLVWFKRTRTGFWVTAVRDSPEGASACGVPVMRTRVAVFVVAAMIAAPAGVIYAQYNLLVNPDLFLGVTALFQVLVVALVGGSARPWGSLVGAVAITELSYYVTKATGSHPGTGPLTFAIIFLLVAVLAPRGLSGTWATMMEKRRKREVAGALRRVGAPAVGKPAEVPVPSTSAGGRERDVERT